MSEKLNRDNEQISNENSWDTSEFPAFDPKAAEEAIMRATERSKAINNEYSNSYFKIDENGKLEFNDAGPQPIEATKFYDKNGEEIKIEDQDWFMPPTTPDEPDTPPEPETQPTPPETETQPTPPDEPDTPPETQSNPPVTPSENHTEL